MMALWESDKGPCDEGSQEHSRAKETSVGHSPPFTEFERKPAALGATLEEGRVILEEAAEHML